MLYCVCGISTRASETTKDVIILNDSTRPIKPNDINVSFFDSAGNELVWCVYTDDQGQLPTVAPKGGATYVLPPFTEQNSFVSEMRITIFGGTVRRCFARNNRADVVAVAREVSSPVIRLQVIITGYVQGVNFRAYARREAERLGLKGYALNRSDGTVEVVAEGERTALEKLLAWLQHGPPSARVDQVSPRWGDATGEFMRFEVRL